MLQATRDLLSWTDDRAWAARGALIRAVTLLGSQADAEALLPRFLGDPGRRADLLEPIARLGDAAMARELYGRFARDGHLAPGAPGELLWAFGWHGLSEAAPMLLRYVAQEGDYAYAPAAVMGLAHLPLEGLEPEARRLVESCFGRDRFPEFLPALAGRLGDLELLDRAIAHARTTASPSYLGGVVLAAGLFGPRARSRFVDMLWDPALRVWDGPVSEAAIGMRLQGVTLGELCASLRTRCATGAPDELREAFILLERLADRIVDGHLTPSALRFAPPAPETAAQMHKALFAGSAPDRDDSIPALTREALGEAPLMGPWLADRLHELERRLVMRMQEEALLGERRG